MREHRILELFDDGEQLHYWSWWKRNYIQVQANVYRGRATQYEREFHGKAFYYFRLNDGYKLSAALKLTDRPMSGVLGEPEGLHVVEFYQADTKLPFGLGMTFMYSPEFGWEAPPQSVLDAPLTHEIVKAWPHYYISGPGRRMAEKTECTHGYLLVSSCPGCDFDDEQGL